MKCTNYLKILSKLSSVFFLSFGSILPSYAKTYLQYMEEAFQAVGIDFDFNKTVFSNQKILFDYSFIPYPEKYSLLETLRLLPSESPINLKNFIEETDVIEEWDDRINSFIRRIKERRRDLLISEISNEKMLHFQRVIFSVIL